MVRGHTARQILLCTRTQRAVNTQSHIWCGKLQQDALTKYFGALRGQTSGGDSGTSCGSFFGTLQRGDGCVFDPSFAQEATKCYTAQRADSSTQIQLNIFEAPRAGGLWQGFQIATSWNDVRQVSRGRTCLPHSTTKQPPPSGSQTIECSPCVDFLECSQNALAKGQRSFNACSSQKRVST